MARKRRKTGPPTPNSTEQRPDRTIVPAALRQARTDNTATGQRHEKRLEKKLGNGAYRVAGSGNQPGHKGDLNWWGAPGEDWWDSVKLDGKSTIDTTRKSFSIKKKHLEKICREAIPHGMTPMMAFEIPGLDAIAPPDWALVPIRDGEAMKKILAKLTKKRRFKPEQTPDTKAPKKHLYREGSADYFNNALYGFLKGKTGWDQRERDDGFLHVSELYDFCPRRAIMKIAFGEPLKQEVKPNLSMLFDHGHMVHQWYQERYFGPMGHLWGTWQCSRCHKKREGVMPSKPCECVADELDCDECNAVEEFGCRLCVHEDSLIATERGMVPIQDLVPATKVWTHEGRLMPVNDVWYEDTRRETVALAIDEHIYPLILTPDHPVLVDAGDEFDEVDAGDLRVGQTVFTMNRKGYPKACKVVGVTDGPKSRVWNMEVEEDASYYANGVLVGNCTRWGRWKFREPRVFFKKYGVVGSSDGVLVNLPGDRRAKRVWEIKTIKKEMFDRLSQPYTRHLSQASIYGMGLGVDHIMFSYHAKADMGDAPKAFRAEVDEALAYEDLSKAQSFWAAVGRGRLAPAICSDKSVNKAQRCPDSQRCFRKGVDEEVEDLLGQAFEDGALDWIKNSLEIMKK